MLASLQEGNAGSIAACDLARVKSSGNADSIAESDSTRIFIHSFVITLLK